MSNLVTIQGELWYARTDEPETDPWNNTKWKVTVRPSKEQVPEIMDMIATYGLKNRLSKTQDGSQYQITFSRPATKETSKGVMKFEKPKVYQADGKTELTDWIGNGSKGEVTVEMRQFTSKQYGKGYSARLESIRVTDFVPYQKGNTDGVEGSEGF